MNIYTPTVLVVDDDPVILEFIERKFLSETIIGVAVADSMKKANRIIEDSRYKVDAIISDMYFDQAKKDIQNNLDTGIDLLQHAKEILPDVCMYVVSVNADDHGYRSDAEEKGIPVRKWYRKLEMGVIKPWKKIEADLINHAWDGIEEINSFDIQGNKSIKVEDSNEILSSPFKAMTKNYLTELSEDYLEVIQPIEVVGRFENDVYFATAQNIGVIQSGTGDSFEEAMSELKDLIVDHYEHLIEIDNSYPSSAITNLKSAIEAHIRKII